MPRLNLDGHQVADQSLKQNLQALDHICIFAIIDQLSQPHDDGNLASIGKPVISVFNFSVSIKPLHSDVLITILLHGV
jgi:hypothetical protein